MVRSREACCAPHRLRCLLPRGSRSVLVLSLHQDSAAQSASISPEGWCKLPTTEVVGFPPRGVSAHVSSAVEGGLHDGRSGTRRGFLRGLPTRGLRQRPSYTALIIGGLPSFHRRLMRRERRGVIRPRWQGVLTNAPPRSTRLADRECTRRYGTREHNSNGSETGVSSPEERVGTVGFLPRLKSSASASNFCETVRALLRSHDREDGKYGQRI